MTVFDEAQAAYQAVLDAAAETDRQARRALRQAAAAAVGEVLVRPNGTVLTPTEAPLTIAFTDMAARMVVVQADGGNINLAAVQRENDKGDTIWVVRLAQRVDGQWSQVPGSDRIRSLADLWLQIGTG